jgi:hypothetical protein
MRINRRRLLIAVGAAAVVITTAGFAASPAQSTAKIIHLEYKVTGQPTRTLLTINFESGVGANGVIAEAPSGGIKVLSANDRGTLQLAPSGSTPLDADITQFLVVSTAEVSGTADIPRGTSVTLTNFENGTTITLTGGPFSISTGVLPRMQHPSPRAARPAASAGHTDERQEMTGTGVRYPEEAAKLYEPATRSLHGLRKAVRLSRDLGSFM